MNHHLVRPLTQCWFYSSVMIQDLSLLIMHVMDKRGCNINKQFGKSRLPWLGKVNSICPFLMPFF